MITKWISTTIKKEYLDQILIGKKVFEYKVASIYWTTRILSLMTQDVKNIGLNLLCGKDDFKFEVKSILYVCDNEPFVIDGVPAKRYFVISIGLWINGGT